MQNQFSGGVLPEEWECSVDVLEISGGISLHGCDLNKVGKRICRDRASVLGFSCGFTSFLGASSLESTSGGMLLNGDNFICNF